MGKKGLWANVHAKRKRGESPAKPGDEDYPTDEALKESAAKMISPLNHCNSEMMHQGGWAKMRTLNSPGTTGNKEGVKHNEEMRNKIGTFNMPHSPLNQNKTNKDSIASSKAWKAHKAEYLKKPGGEKEYDMEKGEFYYDTERKKLRLIPTDDGEVKDTSGIEDWQLAPERKSSALLKSRCWEGYEPTPGVKAYEPGSCRKK